MKRENWQLSYTKWHSILQLLQKKGRVDWAELYKMIKLICGHCEEYTWACNVCSLSDMSLCGRSGTGEFSVLFYMARGSDYYTRSKRKALSIAKHIYNAVLEDEPNETSL
jgi:hypothetical protein